MQPQTDSYRLMQSVIFCALFVIFQLTPTQARAATHTKEKQSELQNTKKGTIKVVRQQNNSEESPAQRDRRLRRECKGLPNAGACRGYTH